ncbi:Copiatype Polyprotein [Phytophthora palmivora]|uniref:Copiatype Polyprotein n=1 Tax=Phytophthora palmivora TaxID=4796 RepID=A0A2P4YVL7_9STRA|nr:Copiatype Polyprotein [Phytophthora palmivora]
MVMTSGFTRKTTDGKEGPEIDYSAAIGSQLYLAMSTRPDLAYCVGYLSRFTERPTSAHGGAIKRVWKYLAASTDRGIRFRRSDTRNPPEVVKIEGYCDADWGNCPDTRKSITGYVMNVDGGLVVWAALRHSVVAQSTAEAKYISACEACQEGRGLTNIVMEVIPDRTVPFTLGIDNQDAMAMAEHPAYIRKTRHIKLRYHYVRDQVAQSAVQCSKLKAKTTQRTYALNY